jgi:XTP/dITP diphosphohydrolase
LRVESTDLIFVTSNQHKFDEARDIGAPFGINIVRHEIPLTDIQSDDVIEIAEAKVRSAYARLLRPLFIDQTSLHIDEVGGFPAGFTQRFLASLRPDQVCEKFGRTGMCAAEGRTTIAFCDGRRVESFTGTIRGRIVEAPRGTDTGWEAFGFNRVFAPDPGNLTFAEMGAAKKNAMSMRRSALEQLFRWVP